MKTRQNDPVAMARLNELSRIDRKYNVAIWRSAIESGADAAGERLEEV